MEFCGKFRIGPADEGRRQEFLFCRPQVEDGRLVAI